MSAKGTVTVIDLARIWLKSEPPAVAGNGGVNRMIAIAQSLVNGFDLTATSAMSLILSDYNPRCQPPWEPEAIESLIESAISRPYDLPQGWLLHQFAEENKRPRPVTVADLAAGDSKTVYRVMAIMTGVRYGLNDRGEVGLMFAAYISDALGAPQFLSAEVASLVIAAYKVGDVSRLEGKPCWATLDNGLLLFDVPCLI